jgi:hypothetical protein
VQNVTVGCSCGRSMTPDGAAPRGTYRCGCGVRVTVAVADVPQCGFTGDGARCRSKPCHEAAGLGFAACAEHFAVLVAHIRWSAVSPEQREAERKAALESLAGGREIRRLWHEQKAARDAAAAWWVYYIRIGDRIKIGTTGNFKERMGDLMPDEILAAEPGDRKLEGMRHKQFAHLRIRGERFASGEDLMSHITMVREMYPELPCAGRSYPAAT